MIVVTGFAQRQSTGNALGKRRLVRMLRATTILCKSREELALDAFNFRNAVTTLRRGSYCDERKPLSLNAIFANRAGAKRAILRGCYGRMSKAAFARNLLWRIEEVSASSTIQAIRSPIIMGRETA